MSRLLLWLALLLAPPLDLLGTDGIAAGAGLPPGWRVRAVRGHPAPSYSIDEVDGARVLRIRGAGAAAFAFRKLEEPLLAHGTLRWSWRVLTAPEGADLRERSLDDSALRVAVVFGKLGGIFGGKGRAIFYTWGNGEPVTFDQRSFSSDRLHVVRVDGTMEADGAWRDREAQPFLDYARIWPGEAPQPITAIGLVQDTDMTAAEAVAELRWLRWEPAEER